MGRNPVVALIAVIILIVAIIMIAKNMSGGGGGVGASETRVFWYDTGTNKLFGAPPNISPIEAPSGSNGVSAFVFASGSCDNAGDRFIAYLEMFPNKDAIMAAQGFERMPLMEEALVRGVDDEDWVLKNSLEGAEVMAGGQGLLQCVTYAE